MYPIPLSPYNNPQTTAYFPDNITTMVDDGDDYGGYDGYANSRTKYFHERHDGEFFGVDFDPGHRTLHTGSPMGHH